MGTRSFYDVPIVFWCLLTLLIHILTCLGTNSFSIKLIPKYSFDSVLFSKNLSQQEKHNRLVELSKTQALHFQSMNFGDTINSTKQGTKGHNIKELRPLVYGYENFHAATVGIGPIPYYVAQLLVDTGSDETWVQGEGCSECFDLLSGNFKYKESRTYTTVSCDHPLCDPRICIENVCQYSLIYDDGDFTVGNLSSDTFSFLARPGVVESFENVIFGVGMKNSKDPFMSENNVIGRILGLGHGRRSILRQLEDHTNLRFSYCLFDLKSGEDTYTYLHFGEDAQIIGNDQEMVKTIQLLPVESNYYVEVLGITMNEELLDIDPREFQLGDGSKGGFIIDSGTTVTFLVPNAYNVVRDEIVRYLEKYNWKPMVNSGINFDLCYNVQPTESQQFPSLAIKFLAAHLDLGSHRVFKLVIDNIYCMYIKRTSSEEDVNILGSFQQQDYRFLFDVGVGEIKFVPEKCNLN